MSKTTSSSYYWMIITVVLTNLTQIPDWVDNAGVKLLSYVPWLLLAFKAVLRSRYTRSFYLGNQRYLYFLVICILGVCATLEILGNEGINVSLLRPLLMCLFIYVISLNIALDIDNSKLNFILLAYALSSIFVTIFVYQTMLSSGFDWTSGVYAYNSKNSVSQIILTAVFFLIYLHGKKNKFFDIIIITTTAGLILSLFMLKSRASLLGIVIIVGSVLISDGYTRTTKFIVKITIIVFLMVIALNASFRTFFLDSIVFAGRDSSNLNSISSGRMDMINEFPVLFSQRPILGYGRYYVECMPLDALIETGLVGGVFFNIIAIAPIVYAVKAYRKYKQQVDFLLIIVGICYYVNGFFEQLAPFGPGVKCYMLWLLFGFSVAWRKRYAYKSTLDYKYANHI